MSDNTTTTTGDQTWLVKLTDKEFDTLIARSRRIAKLQMEVMKEMQSEMLG